MHSISWDRGLEWSLGEHDDGRSRPEGGMFQTSADVSQGSEGAGVRIPVTYQLCGLGTDPPASSGRSALALKQEVRPDAHIWPRAVRALNGEPGTAVAAALGGEPLGGPGLNLVP